MPPLKPCSKTCLALAIGQMLAISDAGAATISVDTTADISGNDSACTLREAIVSIHTLSTASTGCTPSGLFGVNDTVTFNPGLTNQAIGLTQSAPLSITTDLRISGLGQNSLTISGNANGLNTIFKVNNADLIVSDLTISGGRGLPKVTPAGTYRYGGAVYAQGISTVAMTNCTVSGSSADFGGGMLGNFASTFSLTNSTVSGNSAISNGGGIVTYGEMTLNNSTVSGNSASNFGGGIAARSLTSGKVIRLINSTVSSNLATRGGGIGADADSLSLLNSTVAGNSATDSGGGMRIFGSTVVINNSTVSGNSSTGDGGGIYTTSAADVSVRSSTISNNSSAADGGGVFSGFSSTPRVVNSTLSGNIARSEGGGVFADSSSHITLINTTLSLNRAGALVSGFPTGGGGGIQASGATISLTNSIVSGNTSVAPIGVEVRNAGTIIANKRNLFGDASKSNTVAFSNFSPGGLDINATSNGINKPLSSILLGLANNGGPTKSHALSSSSPATNAGDQLFCTTTGINTDQRGVLRNDGACDIGAFETDDDSCFSTKAANGKVIVFCL